MTADDIAHSASPTRQPRTCPACASTDDTLFQMALSILWRWTATTRFARRQAGRAVQCSGWCFCRHGYGNEQLSRPADQTLIATVAGMVDR